MKTVTTEEARTYDVRASVDELDGKGSDGAYSLCLDGATPEEIAAELLDVLRSDWGLTHSVGPFRLHITIGPVGRGDDL